MIKTVIFDIGNVLTDFSWEPFFRSFGFSEEIFQKIVNATVKSPVWTELDRGVWTTEQIIDGFAANAPELEDTIRRICEDISAIVTKREYAIPWIKHLKANGYQVLYLSNFGELTRHHCTDALSFLPYMDGGILSYEVKVIKPDRAIYELLIKKYALNPAECVFVDDLYENIEAARKIGMYGVHAPTHEKALQGLEALGVPSYK